MARYYGAEQIRAVPDEARYPKHIRRADGTYVKVYNEREEASVLAKEPALKEFVNAE